MKTLRWILLVAAVLMAALVAYALSKAFYPQRPVGFQTVTVKSAGHAPLAVGIWYPTESTPLPTTLLSFNLISVAKDAPVAGSALPLVLISHGNGGGPASHLDLALDLAQSGYIVAAPMFAGDNFADQSAFGSQRWLPDRTSQLAAVLDHMLQQWPARAQIDGRRIGAFGFSAGAFTVLTAIGGQPDLRLVADRCKAEPEFICTLLRGQNSPLLDSATPPADGAFRRDGRIRAAVLVAPGLGFTFPAAGLADVTGPVQLWAGSRDDHVPLASNVAPLQQALGNRAELREVAGAAHFSFLVPCRLFGPPLLCADPSGFDREGMHRQMNESIAEFFRRSL